MLDIHIAHMWIIMLMFEEYLMILRVYKRHIFDNLDKTFFILCYSNLNF